MVGVEIINGSKHSLVVLYSLPVSFWPENSRPELKLSRYKSGGRWEEIDHP